MSSLTGLALWANLLISAAPCQGGPLEVPYAYAGQWPAADSAWLSDELETWFASHGRLGCEPVAGLTQERLVLVSREDGSVALEIQRGRSVILERTLDLAAVPPEGRRYAIAALAEELARARWERPVRRVWSVGASVSSRLLYAGPRLIGAGAALGWAPLEHLALELGLNAAAALPAQALNGTAGGTALWADVGGRYALVAVGPLRLGPRLGVELGRLLLWGVDTSGLRREGGAWWVVARGGLFLGFEAERWAVRLNASIGRTLAGAIVLDGTDRVQVFDGAVGELGLTIDLRL